MIMMMIFLIIITISAIIIPISSLASLGAWLTPESQSWVSHWEDQELGERDKWVTLNILGILAILGLVSTIKSYQTFCFHCCQVNIPSRILAEMFAQYKTITKQAWSWSGEHCTGRAGFRICSMERGGSHRQSTSSTRSRSISALWSKSTPKSWAVTMLTSSSTLSASLWTIN